MSECRRAGDWLRDVGNGVREAQKDRFRNREGQKLKQKSQISIKSKGADEDTKTGGDIRHNQR